MAKDTEKIESEQVIPGKDDGQADAPRDVRSSIREAMKEVAEKEEPDGEVEASDKEESDEKPVRKARDKAQRPDSDKDKTSLAPEKDESDDIGDDKDEKDESDTSADKKPDKGPAIEPIGYWKTKGKASWDKLPADVKKDILAREKEVSDGFAGISPRLKRAEEIEQVLAPRAQAIQQFGVSPAQVVNRLFQWMEALGHPNTSVKVNSFKELAKSFGLDVNQLASGSSKAQDAEITESEALAAQNQVPEWFNQYATTMNGEIGTIKQTFVNQQKAAAESMVMQWANGKPHFEEVRGLMSQLSRPGPNGEPPVVPLVGGQVDLDGAYAAAIKLHPEVAAKIQVEAAEKTAKEATDKAAKDAKDRAAKLARARNASSSLRPGAPSMGAPSGKPNLNGKSGSGQSTSVRDSIRAAIEETRG